jgi:hypothetical protein
MSIFPPIKISFCPTKCGLSGTGGASGDNFLDPWRALPLGVRRQKVVATPNGLVFFAPNSQKYFNPKRKLHLRGKRKIFKATLQTCVPKISVSMGARAEGQPCAAFFFLVSNHLPLIDNLGS